LNLLKSINRKYLAFAVILYILVIPGLNMSMGGIFVLHIVTVIFYFFILDYQLFKPKYWYTSQRLLRIIFFYGLLYVVAYNFVSWLYKGNFFVFSEVDASRYDVESQAMVIRSFWDGIYYYLDAYDFSDLGAVLVISTLYRVAVSNLIVNVFYFVLALFSGLGLFKLGKMLMPVRYAYLAALTFSLSSYFWWFNSSGLKESVMIFLVIYSFLHYYYFLKTGRVKYLIIMTLFLFPLMLFRPAVMFLIIGSAIVGNLLSRKLTTSQLILVFLFSLLLVYFSAEINHVFNRFAGGGFSGIVTRNEESGMIRGGVKFTYAVNLLAQTIGPLPSILPNLKLVLSFFAPGLIYKNLISIPYLLGIFYFFKRRQTIYYPIILFMVFESFSLLMIMEGLELRKSLPHFPFIYLIGFGFIAYYSNRKHFAKPQYDTLWNLMQVSFYVIFILIYIWNLRYA
jgi:hypothetical protein